MVKKDLSLNWGTKIILKNLYWLVIKLEQKFTSTHDTSVIGIWTTGPRRPDYTV